jgi:O-succinylbenzoate synthase
MLHIEEITLREIRLPLREPFRISSGIVDERRIALLQILDADGVTAWSECVAGEFPNYSPETIDTAWLAIVEWIAPRVLGRTFNDPRELFPTLERDFRGHLMAKAAVEMGVWALAAERLGASLANLLGGTRTEIATGISLGIQRTPAALVEKARAALALGYRKVKIKIAPGMDVEYIAAARDAVGSTAPLMADANNAYMPADTDHLARLDSFDLMMIEQPFAFDDLVQHAHLQRRLRTPICLDESITSVDRARDMVELGSGRIINIKPGRVGGFAASLAINAFCETKGIPVWCGGMLESGIGRACNVALASVRNFTKPGDVSPSARYWERDIVTPEWTMSADGMVRVPVDRRGLGVDVDVDRVDDLTVRSVKLSAQRSRASAGAAAG